MADNSFQERVLSATEDLTQSITVPVLGFLWSWIKRIVPLFVVMLVAVSLAISAYSVYRQWRDRPLKFFVTSGKNNGEAQAELIEADFRRQHSLLWPNYLVSESATGGTLDNLRAVRRDQEGRTIGMVIEGPYVDPNDRRDIRTLIPLQWCYLHFVFRVNTLKVLGVDAKGRPHDPSLPVTLTEFANRYLEAKKRHDENVRKGALAADEYWPIRVYIGQPNSATRQIASLVLRNAKLPLEELEPTAAISTDDEIVKMLLRERIDGAFVVEPPDSKLVGKIAEFADSSRCTLIAVDSANDLINNGFHLCQGEIPAYSYDFLEPFGSADSHLAKVDTLAARRLIVASTTMSNNDAYFLANRILAALPDSEISRKDIHGNWPGPISATTTDGKDYPLSYSLYSGVELDPSTGPSLTWITRNATWIGPLLLAMSIGLITELKNRIPDWLNHHRPAQQSQGAYTELESRLEALRDETMEQYDGGEQLTEAAIGIWQNRLGELARQIRPLRRARKLSRNDVEALYLIVNRIEQLLEAARQPSPAGPASPSEEQSVGAGGTK